MKTSRLAATSFAQPAQRKTFLATSVSGASLSSRARFFPRASYSSVSGPLGPHKLFNAARNVLGRQQHLGLKRALSTTAHNADVTHLIKPGESKDVYAAIYTTSYSEPFSLLLKEKDGYLQTLFDKRGIAKTSPGWLLQHVPGMNNTEKLHLKGMESGSISETKYFSQKNWIHFLDYLNPLIIGNLQVDSPHRRHLVDTYNFCLTDDPIVTRNRSQAVGSFPVIRHLVKPCRFKWEKETTFIKHIDKGLSPIEALKEYFEFAPWATETFFKRMAFASDDIQLKQIGKFLARGLHMNGQFDTKRYGLRVMNIPSSIKDHENFKAMLDVVAAVECLGDNDAIPSQLLINTGNDWAKNKILVKNETSSFTHSVRDYFKAVAEDLLAPYFFTKLSQPYTAKGHAIPDQFTQPDFVNYIIGTLRDIVGEQLTVSLTPVTLQGYSNRWHRNQTVIHSKKPLLLDKTKQTENKKNEWYAIIQDQTIEGYVYEVLTNQQQLSREGEEMHHCVGGYAKRCKAGRIHILSGKGPNGERFTLEIARENNKFIVSQLLGAYNKPVSSDISAAANSLVDQINTGEVTSHSKCGAIASGESLQSQFGFDLFDSQAREGLFQAYQETRVLPNPFQKYKSLSELLEKTGLDALITKMAQDDVVNSATYSKWQNQQAELRNPGMRNHIGFDRVLPVDEYRLGMRFGMGR